MPFARFWSLSFLILVGVVLIGDGLDMHVPKGYIYFAMAFAVVVEMLNLKMRKNTSESVKLNRKNP